MSNGKSDDQNLRTVYTELCISYRAIDDFRTKLLGFLPLATGAGVFFLVTDTANIDPVSPYFRPIGYFGVVITLGLLFYELYGIKKCTHLIWAGKELEKEVNISSGRFEKRPHGGAGLIRGPLAAAVIYPAALAAWSFIAVVSSVSPDYAQWRATRVFFTGLAVLFFYNLKLIIEG